VDNLCINKPYTLSILEFVDNFVIHPQVFHKYIRLHHLYFILSLGILYLSFRCFLTSFPLNPQPYSYYLMRSITH